MVKDSLISIILPVYNGEQYLKQSIESCLNQSYKNIELIIVNDCSTDSSLSIAKDFEKLDSRVRVINNVENKKLPASLNIGHFESKGDYITWTSDDNFYNLNALETMLYYMKNENVDIVYANYNQVRGGNISEIYLKNQSFLIFSNIVGACFLYKSHVYKVSVKYDESLFLLEDYDFWLQCLTQFKFYHIKEVLYNYRVHQSSLTESAKRNKKHKNLFVKNIKLTYGKFFSKLSLDESYVELFSKMHISPFSIKEKNEILNIRTFVGTCINKLNSSKVVKKEIDIMVLKLQLKLLRSVNDDITIFDCLKFLIMNAFLFNFSQFKVWVKLCLNKK